MAARRLVADMIFTLKSRDGRTLTLSAKPPPEYQQSLPTFAYVTIGTELGELTFPLDDSDAGQLVGALFGFTVKAARNPFR